jgi:DNA polymerase I
LRSVRPSSEELIAVFNGLIEQHKLVLVLDSPRKFEGPWALDVEHDEQGTFVGCGLYNGTNPVYYFSSLVSLNSCDFSAVSLICHNGRSDFECLRSWGIGVPDDRLFWDTELSGHIIDSSFKGYGLKSMAKRELGIEYPSYEDIVGKRTAKQAKERITLDKQPLELVQKYNALDCYVTWKLYEKQRGPGARTPASQYFEELERPVAFILSQMENRGICVDLNYLKDLKEQLEQQQKPIKESILNELGQINLNSPRQLLEALNAKEIYPTFKGKSSTDKRALSACKESNTVSLLLRYSELDTLLSTFVSPYLERNQSIVHPWFNQCGTRTGRLSCSNPNLLQIPRRTENGKLVRRMFTARPGMLMGDCDFGQIEPRVMAHLSKDPVLCQMFNDGTDFHDFTAKRLSISRDRAKVLNLSVGYRATRFSVQRQLGGTLEEAQIEIDKWWDLFPFLRRWQENLIYTSKRSGFCSTLRGRRIKVDGLTDGNAWKREAAERQVINNITQGSAAEIMKMAMLRIDRIFHHIGLLVQVYDELLFEAPAHMIDIEAKNVSDCMRNAIKLDVPLTVDCKVGETWTDCR